MSSDSNSVGGRIRMARQARGWTQSDLAQAVRVSRSAVAQWETDRAGQLREHLSDVAEVLGLTVEALLHGRASQLSEQELTGNELALLRLYRASPAEDQALLLRMARKFARPGAA